HHGADGPAVPRRRQEGALPVNISQGRLSRTLVWGALCLAALLTTFPLLYAIAASLMTQADFNAGAVLPSWPLEFGNYAEAFERFPLLRYFGNSFIMAGLVTVAVLVTSSMAAFSFTFIPFRGRGVLFAVVRGTLMIPWEATIIVNFQSVRDLGWLNTFPGLTDRKSTRLNSSHVSISYAVFCLKKKKSAKNGM